MWRRMVLPWTLMVQKWNRLLLVIKRHSPKLHCALSQPYIPIYQVAKSETGEVGAAVITTSNVKSLYHLHPACSVYTAELYAIYQCLTQCPPSAIPVIFTDSLSSIRTLSSLHTLHKLELAQQIAQMSKQRKFIIIWVPSHSGIQWNDAADAAAKEAASLTTPPLPLLPVMDRSNFFQKHFLQRWQGQWDSAHQSRPKKLYLLKPSIGEWGTSSQTSRRFEISLARLRIGHTHLTHSFLMTRDSPPLCPICSVLLTVSHILVDCPAYSAARLKYSLGNTIPSILGNNNKKISFLEAFLRDTQLLTLI